MSRRLVCLPADEVDDGFVFAAGVGRADISSFVHQLQHVIGVGELPAHLPTAQDAAAVLNAHSCNTQRADRHCDGGTPTLDSCSLLT